MKKQMSSGFVIVAVAVMMITSQIPEAFTQLGEPPITCTNDTLSGSLNAIVFVPDLTIDGGPFNICVLDGATNVGDVIVGANAALFVYDGSFISGNVKIEGEFSSVNFEGTEINTVVGSISAIENTYVFLDSVTINSSVQSKGEVYVTSLRGSGPVIIGGDFKIEKTDNTNEFVLDTGSIEENFSIGGNLDVFGQLSVRITDAKIGGNLLIKENENTSGVDSFIIVEDSTVGGNFELSVNKIDTVLLSNNNIDGNFILNDNVSDDPIIVQGNTIVENFSCDKNNPPPENSGNINTVLIGLKEKQCLNL